MSSASNMGKFIVGALVGGFVGAAFGMLLAPRSGAETREKLCDGFDSKVRGMGENLREKKEQFKETADHLKDKVVSKVSEMEEAGRRAYQNFTDKPESV